MNGIVICLFLALLGVVALEHFQHPPKPVIVNVQAPPSPVRKPHPRVVPPPRVMAAKPPRPAASIPGVKPRATPLKKTTVCIKRFFKAEPECVTYTDPVTPKPTN